MLFYDKNGIQARIAYNWRNSFLNTTGPNPIYTEAYGQVDANASYEIRKGLGVFVEIINLTGSDQRQHERSDLAATYVAPGDARYYAGFRVSF